jgi:hypothetical protein
MLHAAGETVGLGDLLGEIIRRSGGCVFWSSLSWWKKKRIVDKRQDNVYFCGLDVLLFFVNQVEITLYD